MSSEIESPGNPFQVEQHESLPEVLDRLRGHRGESLSLVISDHSPILLTATEFRALKDLADRQNLRVHIRTDDTLRLQLASMFGFARAARRPEPDADGPEPAGYQFGSWRNVRRPKHRPAGQAPEVELPPAADEPAPEQDDPITVSRRRRNMLYNDSVARDRADDDIILIDDAGLDYIEDDENRGRGAAWLYGRIAAGLLVVLVVALAALWYWYPAVQLDVTLRKADISTDIVYSVAAPDAQVPSDASFAVQADEQSAEVPFSIEIPASGVDKEPDGTASGTVLFRNVSGAPVTLEQGTELATMSGMSYLLLEPLEVPAGDIDTPGEAEAPVTAAQPGAAGNREAGALTGKVPDQDVYYSNLTSPIDGGTDREYPVVTEADVAEAERTLAEDLQPAAAEGWRTTLPDGMAIVGPSVQPGDPASTIEGAAGDRRESVSVTGTVPVTGYVYSLADVEQQSRSTFEVALQDQVPPGYELVASTIELGEPEVIAEAPQNVEYRVSANATARAIFDEGARNGLKQRMAGSSVEEARAAVEDVGAIETWQMSHSPGWWPDRMPRSDGRITLEIRESLPGGAAPPASPAATPDAGAGS